jgi:hypothetical protein
MQPQKSPIAHTHPEYVTVSGFLFPLSLVSTSSEGDLTEIQ